MIEMSDIYLEPVLLSATITELEKDNQQILSVIVNINKKIKKLDESVWKSPEKEKLDNTFFVYLNEIEESVPVRLNDCIIFMKNALEKYQQEDLKIANKADGNYLDIEKTEVL